MKNSKKSLPFSQMFMTRRRFLLSTVTGLLGAYGLCRDPAAAIAHHSSQFPSNAIETELKTLFSSIENARAVGRRYLILFPDEANRRFLLENSVLNALRRWPATDRASLRKALCRQRSQEFLNGNTVILDGWVLARCEAHLYALMALA